MTLKILTSTRGDKPNILAQCQAAVEAVKTHEMEHKILVTPVFEEWARSKFREVLDSDFTAFVDDDDEVLDALPEAFEVMKANDVGIVCAPEIIAYPRGHTINTSFNKSYEGVRECPLELHHLCIINPKYVDKDVLAILEKRTDLVGVDWMIKASAALNGGAITLNRYGYRWNVTKTVVDQRRLRYQGVTPILRTLTQKWGRDKTGRIPVFESKAPSLSSSF